MWSEVLPYSLNFEGEKKRRRRRRSWRPWTVAVAQHHHHADAALRHHSHFSGRSQPVGQPLWSPQQLD